MRLAVDIVGLFAAPMPDASVVLLSEPGEVTRVLPIFIGAPEAQAIALVLAGVEVPRPGTHDLMVAALEQLQVGIDSVTVTELRDGAFLAEVEIQQEDRHYVLDARPSDGIALALRTGAGLFVSETVMNEAGVAVQHTVDEPFNEAEIERIVADFHDFLATTEPDDFDIEGLGEPDQDEEPDPGEQPDQDET